MQPLNYCRQLAKSAHEIISVPSVSDDVRNLMYSALDLVKMSQKFILPRGGRLHDDREYRALDETEQLRLPHPFIALEFQTGDDVAPRIIGKEKSSKRVIFAREQDNWIVLLVAWWRDATGAWVIDPQFGIPRVNYLDRTKKIEGYTAMRLSLPQNISSVDGQSLATEAGTLLCFLNAMQCSNVHAAKLAKKNNQKKPKSALRFDDYHILTIDGSREFALSACGDGSHRSPREHLRRGHIRRIQDGRRIWVNAAMVNPGVGGKVTKDYLVRA